MKNGLKQKNGKKDAYLSIRIDKMSKKKIIEKAKKLDMSESDYIRDCCLIGRSQKTEMQLISESAVIAQKICNHVEEKYSSDVILEGWTKEIWKNIL